jgi:uncharacterized protein (TIGR00369 family)
MNPLDTSDAEGLLRRIREIFSRIPFNQVLGLEIRTLNYEQPQVAFRMGDELIGNYVRGTLHGGVISTVIDVTGGLTAFLSLQRNANDDSLDEKLRQFELLGTIDLRVDFLRPGRGTEFVATGHNLRTGRRIAVSRVEVANETGELIAVGTGAYVIS